MALAPSNVNYSLDKRRIYVPKGIYNGTQLLGTITDRDDGPKGTRVFSARKTSGAHMQFDTWDMAEAWLFDGVTRAPLRGGPLPDFKEPPPKVKTLFKPEGGTEQAAPPPPKVKVARPPKEEAQDILDARAKMKAMKFPEVEAWAKKIGAKYDPVAPNAGVMRMRVQNAILSVLKRGA